MAVDGGGCIIFKVKRESERRNNEIPAAAAEHKDIARIVMHRYHHVGFLKRDDECLS